MDYAALLQGPRIPRGLCGPGSSTVQLVMFDIDGTLVDSDGFDGDLYAQAIREILGVEIDRSWRSYRHVTDGGILAELLPAQAAEAAGLAGRVKRRFLELLAAQLELAGRALAEIPGARALLERLRSTDGIVTAIATGGWRESAELKLACAGIGLDGIALATGSDAVARIDIMRLAERRAGAGRPFRRRTYFGDGPWDQRASAELGFDFVAVGTGVEHPLRFRDLSDHEAILATLGVPDAGRHRSV